MGLPAHYRKDLHRWWMDQRQSAYRRLAAFLALGVVPTLVIVFLGGHALTVWPTHYSAAKRAQADAARVLATGLCDQGNTQVDCGALRRTEATPLVSVALRGTLWDLAQDFNPLGWIGCTQDTVCMHYIHRVLDLLLGYAGLALAAVALYFVLMAKMAHDTHSAFALRRQLEASLAASTPRSYTLELPYAKEV